MTLDDLERQNMGFYGFFGNFGLRHRFQEWIAPKSIEIDIEKLHMKFSALNIDFNGPSLHFLGSRRPVHESIKSGTPVKVVILPLLVSLSWKRLQIGMGMLLITTSTSDKLFSRSNIDDFERPWTSKIRGFLLIFAIFGCSTHSKNELQQNGWR